MRSVGHGSQPPEWDYRVKNLKAGETVCGHSGTWHSPDEENNNSEIVKNCDNTGGSKKIQVRKDDGAPWIGEDTRLFVSKPTGRPPRQWETVGTTRSPEMQG